jgi:hypothetical protein
VKASGRLTLVTAIAFVALFGAMVWPVQQDGWTQSAHYALVRALADGTPRIDRYEPETGDISYRDGHYYSAKAPGVAFVAVPVYAALHAVGLWPDNRLGALRLLALIDAVLPSLLLVLLMIRVADAVEPGSGLAAGLTLGLATMVLPFSTIAFSHTWSALFALACFAVVMRERRGAPRLGLLAAAGALAGLGVVFEFPTALAGLIVGILAIARPGRLRRGLAYAGGVLAGVLPLLAYNAWAFGSPLRLSYGFVVSDRGDSGHDVVGAHSHGVFGVTWPSLRVLAELLVSDRGLLVLTPVVAAGVAGLVLLLRANRDRAAALTSLAIVVAFPIYNAGVTTTFGGPFGGDSAGPRYLVTALPFALLALGVAYRRAAAPVLALAAVSLVTMTAATATVPLVGKGEVHRWWDGIRHGRLADTVTTLLGWQEPGYAAALPFFACVAVAAATGTWAFLGLARPRLAETAATVAALGAWAFVALTCPPLLEGDPTLGAGALALLALAAAVVVAVVGCRSSEETLPVTLQVP